MWSSPWETRASLHHDGRRLCGGALRAGIASLLPHSLGPCEVTRPPQPTESPSAPRPRVALFTRTPLNGNDQPPAWPRPHHVKQGGSQRAPWIDVPSAPPGSRSGPPRVRGRECSFPGLSPVPSSRVLTPSLLWIMAQPPDVLVEKKLWPHGAQIFLPGGRRSTGLFHPQSALALQNLHSAAHKLLAQFSAGRPLPKTL